MLDINLKSSAKLRLLIGQNGESLAEFSKRIGISQGYLSQILTGRYNPSAKVAYQIAKGLDVNIDEIFLINAIDISIGEGI